MSYGVLNIMNKQKIQNHLSVVIIGTLNSLANYKTLRNIAMLDNQQLRIVEVIFIYRKFLDNRWKQRAESLFSNIEVLFKNRHDFSIRELKGDTFMVINSGDYISFNCLDRFYALSNREHAVFVPQEKIIYGKQSYVSKSISSEDVKFKKSYILFNNIWGRTFFVHKDNRELFTSKNLLLNSAGFLFNALNHGVKIEIIPETVSFICFTKDNELSTLNNKIPKMANFKTNVNSYISCQEVKEKDDTKSTFLPNKIKGILDKIKDHNDDRHILKKISAALFPKLYLKFFVIKNRYFQTLNKKFDAWLLKEWRRINEIEPKLYPLLEVPRLEISTNKNLDTYLEGMLMSFPKNVDYLIFAPWINIGGADKLTLNLIKGIKEKFPRTSIGLITTEKTRSNLQSLQREGVYFFDLGNSFENLTTEEREVLLKRFIIQLSPKRIVNVNSHLLFNLLLKSSKELSYFSDLFCFCFSPSRSKEGQLTGFSVDYIPKIIADVKFVLTDNRNIINFLVNTFGLDENKFKVLYQPIEISEFKEKNYQRNKKWNVLWASRIDYEKLPSVLDKIIMKSTKKMSFHIYGRSVIDKKVINLNSVKRRKNVKVYGEYKEGLRNINTDSFDVYLYTSWFDGMPNVVLEAMSLGLPVIASDVGGIKEIITDKKTGFLIKDIFNEEEYIVKLQELISGLYDLNAVRKNAFRALKRQHSWEKYLDSLFEIFK